MKRFGNLYNKICNIENIKLAHKNASKGKSNYKEVIMVNKAPDYYFNEIKLMLENKTNSISSYYGWIKSCNAFNLWNAFYKQKVILLGSKNESS